MANVLLVGTSLLLVLNVITFGTFFFDKRQAQRQGQRISEATLLGLALLGGWPGAKLAQRRFRHKTKKQPFRTQLNAIPFLWLLIAGTAIWLGGMPTIAH